MICWIAIPHRTDMNRHVVHVLHQNRLWSWRKTHGVVTTRGTHKTNVRWTVIVASVSECMSRCDGPFSIRLHARFSERMIDLFQRWNPEHESMTTNKYQIDKQGLGPHDCFGFVMDAMGMSITDKKRMWCTKTEEVLARFHVETNALRFKSGNHIIFIDSFGKDKHHALYLGQGWCLSRVGFRGELEVEQIHVLHGLYTTVHCWSLLRPCMNTKEIEFTVGTRLVVFHSSM